MNYDEKSMLYFCRFLRWPCGRRRRRREQDKFDMSTFLEVLTDITCNEEEEAENALTVAEVEEMNELRRDGEAAREGLPC